MIKELIKLANELDKRGLVSEASILDKIAGDIIQFDLNRRKNPIDPKPSEEASGEVIGIGRRSREDSERLSESIGDLYNDPAPLGWNEIVENDYFNNPIVHPNGVESIVESGEIINAFIKEYLTPEATILNGDSTLEDVLHSESQELRDYMLEVMPDLIYDVSGKLQDGDTPDEHMEQIIIQAKEMKDYELDDDFKYIIDNMEYYLRDYIT